MTREELESHPFFADCSIEVGDGWLPVLSSLAAAIDLVAPRAKATRVKEKFGSLEVYTDALSPDYEEGDKLVRMARLKASTICEKCGAPGYKDGKYWLKTLCDKHHAELNR